jgi:hypothetical protein
MLRIRPLECARGVLDFAEQFRRVFDPTVALLN